MKQPVALRSGHLFWLVLWVSTGVLGFEIALLRMLLVASWHHFAFIVISIALLGFGASGTVLTFARRLVLRHGGGIVLATSLAAAVSMPVCAGLVQHVPIESRIVPALLWRQLGAWTLYWTLLTIPFLLGAIVIGAALMLARARLATIYAGNLFGSAAGAILAPLSMAVLPPAWLPVLFAIPAWLGALGLPAARRLPGLVPAGAAVLATAVYLLIDQPAIRIDPFKYSAHVERLIAQDAAEPTATAYGPRAVVRAVRSEALHDLLFLSTGESPPPLTVITIDGHWAGSVLDVDTPQEASVVDQMLMAFPYEIAPSRPRVLLLGEIGGTNTWLARRRGAAAIDVVQPYPPVFQFLRGPLHSCGGAVLRAPAVRTFLAEPRHYLEHGETTYDIIQAAALEGSAAGSGGIGGMGQDYLATVQGLDACLDRLSDDGVFFVCRAIQTPPRDNIKLLATLVEALHHRHVEHPERHVVIVRDYLAICTIVSLSPWTEDDIAHIRRICRERQFTPVWFEGIQPEELNRPDALPSPPDGVGDWYYHAAQQLFFADADAFIDDWLFDIRPPTDSRPFFLDFCRLRGLGALRDAFGDLWLTRAESAFLFVLAAGAIIAVVGLLLTVLPLLLLRAVRGARHHLSTAAYFTAIGLAYLLLEITCLSRLTLWIGDPVLSAGVTIAGLLVCSGLGSLTAQYMERAERRLLTPGIVLLVILAVGEVLAMPAGVTAIGPLPVPLRCAAGFLALAPLGYVMGFPMPIGLRRLDRAAPALLPWAWGMNGFASVLASPLATAIGMAWGFHIAAIAAASLYAFAGLTLACLPPAASTTGG